MLSAPFANMSSGCPAFPPTCLTFGLEKPTSDAKFAFLTGAAQTGLQQYAGDAWATADLFKPLCSWRALSIRAVKLLP